MLTRQQALRGAQNFVLIFLSIGIVALYSSWRRPIWTDEAFHYAWGGFTSWGQRFTAIWGLITGTSPYFSTEWLYFLINSVSLNSLGASSAILRMPSAISALVMLGSAVVVLRIKGYSLRWQILCVITFLGQTFIMYFSGEARPYMALAALTLANLVYFSANSTQRNGPLIRYTSWVLIALLVLIHPFGIMYVYALWGWSLLCYGNQLPKFEFNRIWLRESGSSRLILASAIALVNHGPVWFLGGASQAQDPFAFSSREALLTQVLVAHLGHLASPHYTWRIILILALVALLIAIRPLPHKARPKSEMFAPAALILAAFTVTGALILISYVNEYWILSRQWIASMALVTFGTIWLVAAAAKLLSRVSNVLGIAAWMLFALAVVPIAWLRSFEQVDRLREYDAVHQSQVQFWSTKSNLTPEQIWATDGLVGTSNANSILDREVWPVVACLYGANCPSVLSHSK